MKFGEGPVLKHNLSGLKYVYLYFYNNFRNDFIHLQSFGQRG